MTDQQSTNNHAVRPDRAVGKAVGAAVSGQTNGEPGREPGGGPSGRPPRFGTVLIANRGEIAVRVARACRDAGLRSVAVYAEPDRDAPHTRAADEAYGLGGSTSAESYLDQAKILNAAKASGADAVHPGYGFLSENAEFAQAVLDAGLVWIGPPPSAIRLLGDKVSAREIAGRVGAPLAAGTIRPVDNPAEAMAFAEEYGLPIAIKAAYGGGGRGLKVARTMSEIPALLESATREAVAAFGRGECFLERYLDRARHVETQCLADDHGNVVVVSTRDCSLQRRHQKVVEEAPAPFLTDDQDARLREASRAILIEAGYRGAGTCEFLIGADGTISFLEVNTRLQVEHPVSEEVTGVDLVLEQFRLAAGEPLGYGDPPIRGHALEFRINCEDAGRGFLPVPGTLTRWRPPSGPGVRVDSGVEEGTVVGGQFDSMLAKLIVTGPDRPTTLARARRALAEFEAEGLATTLPFHRAVVDDPAFAPPVGGAASSALAAAPAASAAAPAPAAASTPAPTPAAAPAPTPTPTPAPTPPGGFLVHTRWIETEFVNRIEPYTGTDPDGSTDRGAGEEWPRHRVTVEVDGRRLEITLPAELVQAGTGRLEPTDGYARPRVVRPAATRSQAKPTGAGGGAALLSPMQGTVVKIAAVEGERVEQGELLMVLEAMKMEQPINAHRAGIVKGLTAEVGATIARGAPICSIAD